MIERIWNAQVGEIVYPYGNGAAAEILARRKSRDGLLLDVLFIEPVVARIGSAELLMFPEGYLMIGIKAALVSRKPRGYP